MHRRMCQSALRICDYVIAIGAAGPVPHCAVPIACVSTSPNRPPPARPP
jgi:hypothetical protein